MRFISQEVVFFPHGRPKSHCCLSAGWQVLGLFVWEKAWVAQTHMCFLSKTWLFIKKCFDFTRRYFFHQNVFFTWSSFFSRCATKIALLPASWLAGPQAVRLWAGLLASLPASPLASLGCYDWITIYFHSNRFFFNIRFSLVFLLVLVFCVVVF